MTEKFALPELELLLGPYRSGKTSALINELLDLKLQKPLSETLILVPSARYGKLLKERIFCALRSRGKKSALFSIKILPFYQACLELVSKSDGKALVIPEEIRAPLVSKILAQMIISGEACSLQKVASFNGTAAALIELIDEFERSGLSPDDLISRLERSSSPDSRFLELAAVYGKYWQELSSRQYYDQKTLAFRAREILFDEKEVRLDFLAIDGFDRVSHLQSQIFAGFAARAKRSLMSFDFMESSDASEADCTFVRAGEALANALKQEESDYWWKKSSFSELELQFSLILKKTVQQEGAHDSIVCKASSLLDPFLEMQEAARQIKERLLSGGLKANEVVVVIRSPDTYLAAIETAFEESGIAYFIDGSGKIADLPAWRFVASMFAGLKDSDFARKEVIDLLRSPFMNLEALSLSPADVSLLDRISYEASLIGGIASWKKFIAARVLSKYVSLLEMLELLDGEPVSATAREHALYLENLLDRFMILPASKQSISLPAALKEREVIKAVRRVLQVLILQDQLLDEAPSVFKHFWKKFSSLIEQANYARHRPQEDAVLICSAELVPNRKFKDIYICGVVEGEFPRHQRSGGFLSPEEVKLWLSHEIDIRNPRHEPGFERALFYSLTERATERLSLSASEHAVSSEENLPSFYLSELHEKIGLKSEKIAPYGNAQFKPLSACEFIAASIFQYGYEQALARAESNVYCAETFAGVKDGLAASLNRGSLKSNNLFNGQLMDFFESGALSCESIVENWTATKINDYGKCPFRFWLNHVLSIKPREESKAGLNHALVGLFYHKVLELYFSAQLDAAAGSPTLDSDVLARSFASAVEWLESRRDFQAGPYWQQEQKELFFRISRFLEKEVLRLASEEPAFRPQMFEVNFGTANEKSHPALSMNLGEGRSISISGSIDRVDIAGSGKTKLVRIIDYKSSSRRISPKEAEEGRNLQLPVYALAVEQSIMPGHHVSKGEYLSIASAQAAGYLNFESEKLSMLKEQSAEMVRTYASSAYKGDYSVRPNGSAVCKDCPHSGVCRISELKSPTTEEIDAVFD